LIALGLIYCNFYQRCLWKAAVLIIFLIPAAIVANALRVAAMGIFPSLQEGFLHLFSGWLIFIFCFSFMGLLNWLLNYLMRQSTQVTNNSAPQETATNPMVSYKPISHTFYVGLAIVLLIIFLPVDRTLSRVQPKPLLKSFDSFPLALGGWHGQSSKIADDIFEITGAETYLNADYVDPKNNMVNLWIAYYGSHKYGTSLNHSPEYCMVGSGWRIIDSKTQYIAPGLPVNVLLMERYGARTLVYYWYLQQGQWVANKNTFKFFMGFNGLIKGRTDWTLIRLIIPVRPDLQTATQHLNSFARLLLPVIPQFIQE
jgi:EpsI family protein